MKIKWLGHASFMIISDTGTKIITDPYLTGGNLGYGEIRESADVVTVSHDHSDHNNIAAVLGNPKVISGTVTTDVKGTKLKGIACYHDDVQGKQRGKNIIFCFEVDGIRVCHLGDLGHQLSNKEAVEIGKVDILLIPVGGFYTIDAKVASQVCDRLKPKVIIPMHFQNNRCVYPIAGVDEFLRGNKDVERLNTSEAEFKLGELQTSTQIIVLEPAL